MNKENQLWNQFLTINEFRKYPILSSLLNDFEGDHLVGYTYIDHEKGITLDVLLLFSETNNNLAVNTSLPDKKTRVILRFEEFSQAAFHITDDSTISQLSATVPDYLQNYQRKELESFRTEKSFDKYRVAGFPDDIQILLIDNKNNPELIWARVENYDQETEIGMSKLIVQPHQNFNLNIHDDLLFKLM